MLFLCLKLKKNIVFVVFETLVRGGNIKKNLYTKSLYPGDGVSMLKIVKKIMFLGTIVRGGNFFFLEF